MRFSPWMSILKSIHETLFNLLIETAQKIFTENLICLKNLRKAKNFIPLKAMTEISFFSHYLEYKFIDL
jgi:hypothetical protein